LFFDKKIVRGNSDSATLQTCFSTAEASPKLPKLVLNFSQLISKKDRTIPADSESINDAGSTQADGATH